MTNTTMSDLFVAACYITWAVVVVMGSVLRDTRRQMAASL